MGSVYAGLVASAGDEVWAIDAWREHVQAMREKGLRLEGSSGDTTVKAHATTDARDARKCDLVILATMAVHVAALPSTRTASSRAPSPPNCP
jgi:2-dehydropantoate 2-reductase